MTGIIERKRRTITWAAGIAGLVLSAACGTSAPETAAGASAAPATPGGLTAFQVEHGIGPVTTPVAFTSAIDEAKAEKGEDVFEQKCAACHKMAERYVGPALGDVTTRRTPAFVMNMMLNPQGMVEKHPETKKLLAEYFVPMPNVSLSEDEARNVLEYLRTQKP